MSRSVSTSALHPTPARPGVPARGASPNLPWSARLTGAAGRVVAATLCALLLIGCGPSGDPDLVVQPNVRAAVPVSGSSQVVVTIDNNGDGDDELVGASTDAALGVEIHLTEIVNDRATMTLLDSATLPAGERTRFAPGGLHLMLVVPDATVVEGATFDMTLHFDRSDDITVTAEVVPLVDLAEDAINEELLDP